MKFILPFPPHILSPNSRKHWRAKQSFKIAMRQAGIDSGKTCDKILGAGRIAVRVMFYPPNLRWDLDGMFSAAKPIFDGLAIGLGINDKQFRPFLLDCQCADKVTPRVEITLYQKKDKKVQN